MTHQMQNPFTKRTVHTSITSKNEQQIVVYSVEHVVKTINRHRVNITTKKDH